MQTASDAVAILAILAGTAVSFALSSRVIVNRPASPTVEVLVPNASVQDGVLRFRLPSEDGRMIRIRPEGELRVMHVPTLHRGDVVVSQERHKRKKRRKRRRPAGR